MSTLSLIKHLVGEAVRNRNHPVWREIEQMLQDFRPDFVGITAMSNKYPMVERIAEISKSVREEARVIVGGHHPSLFGETLIRDRNIDYVVQGEGEMTLTELVQQCSAPENDLSAVKGLIYKEEGHPRINSAQRTDPGY